MKMIACLAVSLLAAVAEPALADPAQVVTTADATTPAPSRQVHQALMRAALDAQKEQAKRERRRSGRTEADDCQDCSEAARRRPHPTASEAPRVDCIE